MQLGHADQSVRGDPTLAEQSEIGDCRQSYYPTRSPAAPARPRERPDQRITNVTALPAGPFQLTNGSTFVYDEYAASPVHRFYQMWQQLNCSVAKSTRDNPSGCNGKLFSWVEVTVGRRRTNGETQPPNFSIELPARRHDDRRGLDRARLLQRAKG